MEGENARFCGEGGPEDSLIVWYLLARFVTLRGSRGTSRGGGDAGPVYSQVNPA